MFTGSKFSSKDWQAQGAPSLKTSATSGFTHNSDMAAAQESLLWRLMALQPSRPGEAAWVWQSSQACCGIPAGLSDNRRWADGGEAALSHISVQEGKGLNCPFPAQGEGSGEEPGEDSLCLGAGDQELRMMCLQKSDWMIGPFGCQG